MSASYLELGLDGDATFELFVRSLPERRRFLVACGLDPALDHLDNLTPSAAECDWLEATGRFGPELLERLAGLRFTGDVWAVPEGELVFAGEPLLRVTAPLVEASVAETALLNLVGHSTMVASKAARVGLACAGRPFVDFAARRDHGPSAALLGARAAYVGGAAGTSLVSAGMAYGLPLSGTMAHAYVLRLGDEEGAFRAYARAARGEVTLLIDTYDTEEGARKAARVARELATEGRFVAGVRLDSGDLVEGSRVVRAVLDDAGCTDVRILASGDLDEYVIADLVAAGAPVDAFGVGTRLGTSDDEPSLGVVYKLVDDVDGPRAKRSPGKVTLPGAKQVWRRRDGSGAPVADVLALEDEVVDGAEPLLRQVVAGGRRLVRPPLAEARERCATALGSLPPRLRSLEVEPVPPFPVELAPGLHALAEAVGGPLGRPVVGEERHG
jgi:nicotinate phosphoribosyltransferase